MALATGMAWLADGSDLGGSLRTPGRLLLGRRPAALARAACRTGPRRCRSTRSPSRGRWPATCATSPCSSTCWRASTRAIPLSYDPPAAAPIATAVERPRAGCGGSPSRADLGGITPVDAGGRRASAGGRPDGFAELGVGGRGGRRPTSSSAVEVFTVLRAAQFAARHGAAARDAHRDAAEARGRLEHRARAEPDGRARSAGPSASAALLQRRMAEFLGELRPAALPGRDRAAVPGRAALPGGAQRPPLPQLHRLGRHHLRDHADRLPGPDRCPAASPRRACRSGCRWSAQPRGEAQLLAAAAMLEDALGLAGSVPIDPEAERRAACPRRPHRRERRGRCRGGASSCADAISSQRSAGVVGPWRWVRR